jgi:hypothetical protein
MHGTLDSIPRGKKMKRKKDTLNFILKIINSKYSLGKNTTFLEQAWWYTPVTPLGRQRQEDPSPRLPWAKTQDLI